MKAIHHVVDIDAPRQAVWGALTEQRGLAGWWSTEVRAPDSVALGVRIAFTFAGDFNPVMEVTTLDLDTFEVTWRCIDGHDPWSDGAFTFALAPLEGRRTRLRFWQHYAVELDDDAYGVYNFNWGYYLESLRLLCVEGAGKPFRPGGDG